MYQLNPTKVTAQGETSEDCQLGHFTVSQWIKMTQTSD